MHILHIYLWYNIYLITIIIIIIINYIRLVRVKLFTFANDLMFSGNNWFVKPTQVGLEHTSSGSLPSVLPFGPDIP